MFGVRTGTTADTGVATVVARVRGVAATPAHPARVGDVPKQKLIVVDEPAALTDPFKVAVLPPIAVATVVVAVGALTVVPPPPVDGVAAPPPPPLAGDGTTTLKVLLAAVEAGSDAEVPAWMVSVPAAAVPLKATVN